MARKVRVTRARGSFDASEHPRDSRGRFTPKDTRSTFYPGARISERAAFGRGGPSDPSRKMVTVISPTRSFVVGADQVQKVPGGIRHVVRVRHPEPIRMGVLGHATISAWIDGSQEPKRSHVKGRMHLIEQWSPGMAAVARRWTNGRHTEAKSLITLTHQVSQRLRDTGNYDLSYDDAGAYVRAMIREARGGTNIKRLSQQRIRARLESLLEES